MSSKKSTPETTPESAKKAAPAPVIEKAGPECSINFTGTEPTRANPSDAGLDLYAAEETVIMSDFRAMVGTGTYLELPDTHFAMLVPRSSLSVKRDIQMVNGVGIIDAGYRGEVKAPLISMGEDRVIAKGERIVQIVILPVVQAEFNRVEVLGATERGDGGFGSTGA